MSEESQQIEEDARLLELAIKQLLDDFARLHNTMVASVAVTWREQGDGELVHAVKVKTGR